MDPERNREVPAKSFAASRMLDNRPTQHIWALTLNQPSSSAQVPHMRSPADVSMSPTSGGPQRSPDMFPDQYNRVTPGSARTFDEAFPRPAVDGDTRTSRQYANGNNRVWRASQPSGSISASTGPGTSPTQSFHDPSRSPVVPTRGDGAGPSNGHRDVPTYDPTYKYFANALQRSLAAGEGQPNALLRKPTPEIIDLTSSPLPSRGPSRATTPAPGPTAMVMTIPAQREVYRVGATYEPRPSSYTALSKVWPLGPGPGPGPFPQLQPSISPIQQTMSTVPPRRAPNLPPDPKDVIDLSAMSDQEDEEMPDAAVSSIRISPRTAATTTASAEDGSPEPNTEKVLHMIFGSPLNSDDEFDGDRTLRLKILKAPDVFTVGEAHYSSSRDTLKREPRVLSKAEEREVTEWYRGAYNRRQQQLEQQAKGIKPRRQPGDPENHRERPNRGPLRLSGAYDHLSSPLDFNPPLPPGMRFPMGTAPMVPPMMSNIHFVPYINNAKLPPLTTKGSGPLVPGTCRKLFRRYRLEMCHGCDTKQRCSKKDMWKIPDPNDPSSIPPEPPASSTNGHNSRNDRGYSMVAHPDVLMQGAYRPLHSRGPMPGRGMPPDMHPAFFGPPPPHGPYPPSFRHAMHPPPPGYEAYPHPPSLEHARPGRGRSPSNSFDRSNGPSGAPHRPVSPSGATASPHRPEVRPESSRVAGQKRPASPYAV
ncbi:hypothetical protein CALVIDRAFT_393770 [Calocera viscosa TUFC12733]|uniref:Uncharacterized protein n=1 Tax=Calocera viscosa (strain TUFC12733) TaxID=1330018 RepID=A0A167GDC1_CALVF|nr:hypothetical protein CALVIDRAFT_393770 [Calocera viscosa TUFC12733]